MRPPAVQRGDEAMPDITGRCLCGQVSYRASGDPLLSCICHCRNCQRYTGSAFEAVVGFPSAAVRVDGALKTYTDTGESGQSVFRRFCPNCGSGMIAEAVVLPGVTFVLAGAMDDPAAFRPTMELYCSSAQPWTAEAAQRQRFDKMPG